MMAAQKIGRYEVVRELGRGGMAVVYLAYDPYVKRQVAIKLLPRQFTFDPQFRTRFQREAEIIAALEHPFIVPVHDFGGLDDQPFIVMRFMPGGSLLERLRAGSLDLKETAKIVGRLAEALDVAHSQGIIHRDIKPGNILFDGRGEAFLSDFGIAKISETTAALTGTGMIGTPEYMSPDQARGIKQIDGRSDVYSLGVVVYQALTGRLPFSADTPMSMALAHVTQPVPNIRTVKPDLPLDLEAVVARAMAKEPQDRYPTTGQLARDLKRAAEQPAAGNQATVFEPYTPPPVATTAPPVVQTPPPVVQTPSPRPPLTAPAPPQPRGGAGSRTWLLAGGVGLLGVLAVGCCGVLFAMGMLPFFPAAASPTPTFVFVPTDTPDLEATQKALEPTATIAPTLTAVPTSTPPPEIPAGGSLAPGGSWPVVLSDGFNSDLDLWPLGSDSDEFADVTRSISGGNYVWRMTANQGVVSNARPEMNDVTNFFVSVDARQTSGAAGGEYGIVMRHDGSNYYLFIVSEDQQYAFFLRNGGAWTTLIDWTDTKAVVPGQFNQLGVTADGPEFVFYVNGEEIGRASDSQLTSGEVGVAIQLHDAGDTAVFEFDNYQLREAWPVVLADTFDSVANGWNVGSFSDERVDAQRFIDGKYRFQVSALDGFVWRLDPDMESLPDFHLSAEARRVSGPVDAPYGVSFRDDGSNYYYFKIRDEGSFRVALYYNGEWQTVIGWTSTSTIRSGEVNRLAVLGQGSHLTFYINGNLVGEADDSRVGAGTAGVALELNDPGEEAVFEFDNFEVRAPER